MASDALWLVTDSFLETHSGYQEGHFDMREGKDLKVKNKNGTKGCVVYVVNEHG